MAETVLEHLDGRSTFTITTEERAWKNRLVKLAEAHPAEVTCLAVNRDGSMLFHVPAEWVKVKPPIKRNMTDEQRAAFADRMRASRI